MFLVKNNTRSIAKSYAANMGCNIRPNINKSTKMEMQFSLNFSIVRQVVEKIKIIHLLIDKFHFINFIIEHISSKQNTRLK